VLVVSFASAPPNKLLVDGGMALDHEAISQAWGDMPDGIGKDLGGYDWYTTLTFRDPDEG